VGEDCDEGTVGADTARATTDAGCGANERVPSSVEAERDTTEGVAGGRTVDTMFSRNTGACRVASFASKFGAMVGSGALLTSGMAPTAAQSPRPREDPGAADSDDSAPSEVDSV
jgi:hypothetical protein